MIKNKEIFVFGSNMAGIHGAGSAKAAYKKYGATWGNGFGISGRSYAIPTKNYTLRTLPLTAINIYVTLFLGYARQHPECIFNIVAIGCGLAGYTPQQIAPMFENAPSNCRLPEEFIKVLNDNKL